MSYYITVFLLSPFEYRSLSYLYYHPVKLNVPHNSQIAEYTLSNQIKSNWVMVDKARKKNFRTWLTFMLLSLLSTKYFWMVVLPATDYICVWPSCSQTGAPNWTHLTFIMFICLSCGPILLYGKYIWARRIWSNFEAYMMTFISGGRLLDFNSNHREI